MKRLLILLLIFNLAGIVFSQEICNNGIDDDGDGLIDLNDSSDCSCQPAVIPSLIPNASFEQMNCCPSSYSQVSCASGWAQATNATSDYFNCGFNFGAATNAGLVPPPDGTGYLGTIFSPGWQEYVGSCLTSPLIAGQNYTLQMNIASFPMDGSGNVCNGGVINYSPIDITVYGATTCPSFPIPGTGCPSTGSNPTWTIIGTATYTPQSSWGLITINMTPTININAVIIGSPCTLPGDYSGSCYPYFVYDNLILQQSALFSGLSLSGGWCTNDLQISTTTTNPGDTYQWYYNGIAIIGETSTSLNLSQNNFSPGTYTLMTSNSGSCVTATINVPPPNYPSANFTAVNACEGNPIIFNDNSTINGGGSIVSWQWNFGDGNSSTQQNTSHTYANDGTYNTTLIVVSDSGCSDTVTMPVIQLPNPNPDFYIQNYLNQSSINGIPLGICIYDAVTFSDNSTINNGVINSWQWDFGDGNTSTQQNPSHNYSNSGQFNVQLTTISDSGCIDSTTFLLTINPQPLANFTAQNECAGVNINFNNTSTGNVLGSIWDFGDGNSSTQLNPSHAYNSSGIYPVTLIAISDSGCLDTTSNNVEAYPIPNANFTGNDVCIYDSLCFTNLSTVNPSDTIVNYIWNFGDNSPLQNIQNPCHLYSNYGNYNITLIVGSNNGCIDDTTISFYIHDKPLANFTADTPCVNVPPMQFTDLSTVNGIDNINQWNWDFNTGQGASSTQHSTFNFGQDGVFPAQLIVTTDFGCKDTVLKNVKVYEKPTADFSVDTAIFCHPYCVNFSDLSSSNSTNIIAWNWDLGNGEMNNSSAPATCYTNESNTQTQYYTPTLIVENSFGCFDTITKNNFITVWPLPLADFDAQPQPTDIYEPLVEFPNYSVGASSWLWHFGDGSNDSVNYSPQHVYADSGTYYVFLEVWSQYGCYDSIIKPVRINPDYAIFIPNAFTPDGLGGNETFFFKGYGIVEEDFEFWIFDRWGETIYYTQKFKPWDGTYKGEPAKQDVYVYKFIVKDIFDVKHTYIGKVTLLR